jgi:hypothetical protein
VIKKLTNFWFIFLAVCLASSLKMYLKAKEELWKLKYFTMQKIQSSKNPPKETKILQDIKLYN